MNRRKALLPALALTAALAAGGCVLNMPLVAPARSKHMVRETLVEPDHFWTTDKVLLVPIDGILTDSPQDRRFFAEPSPLVRLKDVLKQAEKDPSVKAVLLRINSPGGGVTASDLIYNELKRFKAKTGKKIVALFLDLGASGAYYAAMAGDYIMAVPTTVTGSIGVVAIFPGLEGLTSKIGVSMRVVKSGEFKDIGSMWRALSDPERAILQNTVDSMYERFLKTVADGRPNLDAQTIRRLADGRIYTAQQAKDAGLIDAIGYMDDAFLQAKKMANLRDASLIAYTVPFDYVGHYYAGSSVGAAAPGQSPASGQINLLNLNLGDTLPQGDGPFYYLWVP